MTGRESRPGLPSSAVERARHAAAIEALARGLAVVAHGEAVRTLEALASVVVNRQEAARARRAPPSWGVELGAAVRAAGIPAEPEPSVAEDPFLAACRRIAARAAAGSLPDPTGGALFWHRCGTPRPDEAAGGESLRIGNFVFLRAPPSLPPGEQGWTEAGSA